MTLRAALLLLCGGLLGLAASPAEAEEGWWGGLSKGQNVKLADVLATPAPYKGKTLNFACIFHKIDKYYDPLRSGFNAKRYDNFALWSDGVALWENEDYLTTYPFFYLPKTHRQRDELMRLGRFTRLQVTARIRGSIRGKPAFEVISFRPTGHRLGERVVRQMMDGDKRAKRGDFEVAARRYREVLTSHPDLPPVYGLKVRKRLADALREMGYPDKARRVEGGAPILGSTPLPTTRTDPFQPDTLDPPPTAARGDATGSPDGPARGDATGSPDGVGFPPAGDATGSPDGGLTPPRGDATGSPDGDLGAPPTSWDPPPAGRQPRGADVPGQPYGDLPGQARLGGERRGVRDVRPRGQPPRSQRPRAERPRRPRTQPLAGPAPVELPGGIPPKRTPRLTGVK